VTTRVQGTNRSLRDADRDVIHIALLRVTLTARLPNFARDWWQVVRNA